MFLIITLLHVKLKHNMTQNRKIQLLQPLLVPVLTLHLLHSEEIVIELETVLRFITEAQTRLRIIVIINSKEKINHGHTHTLPHWSDSNFLKETRFSSLAFTHICTLKPEYWSTGHVVNGSVVSHSLLFCFLCLPG